MRHLILFGFEQILLLLVIYLLEMVTSLVILSSKHVFCASINGSRAPDRPQYLMFSTDRTVLGGVDLAPSTTGRNPGVLFFQRLDDSS